MSDGPTSAAPNTDAPITGAPPSAARNALMVIAVILSGATMVWLAPILTPLALAVFLMLMIDAMARDLQERVPALSPNTALSAAVVTCIVVFAVIVFIVGGHAVGFVSELFRYQPRFNQLLGALAKNFHMGIPRTVNALIAKLDPTRYIPMAASGVQALVSDGVIVLLYLGFLLASRHGFERKMVRLFHGRVGRHEALQVFMRIRDSLERYVWIQTLCGALIALCSWIIMLLVGLDNAFFWAFLIFVIGYIPIVGAAIGLVAPALFAFLQFPTAWQGFVLFASMFAVAFIVGNIFMPRMQGRSLNIDPVMILLSLAFWGTIWGLTGMFLSTPLTILVMVVLAQFEGSRWIAVLLSADGDPHSLGAPRPAPAVLSRNSEPSAL